MAVIEGREQEALMILWGYLLGQADESIVIELNQLCIKACRHRTEANVQSDISLVISDDVK